VSATLELRDQPWFLLMQPWELTQRGRGYSRARRRWRNRHRRIFRLEQELGIIDERWKDHEVLPWVYLDYGW